MTANVIALYGVISHTFYFPAIGNTNVTNSQTGEPGKQFSAATQQSTIICDD
jgi:hypothetical protein